jgi:hypothetical protein
MGSAQAQTAQTTRIETRPINGATVTVEHGVRVYRPVPPARHLEPSLPDPLRPSGDEG